MKDNGCAGNLHSLAEAAAKILSLKVQNYRFYRATSLVLVCVRLWVQFSFPTSRPR
jgi:hypothetical protein